MMWGNWGAGWGAGAGLLGGLLMIVFWVLIIVGVVLLVRWLWTAGQSSAPRGESPLDILRKRYARGEITKAEFDERKRDLQ